MFKAGVDLNIPSNSMQLTRPDKEQLQLEALCAARESWLQDLCAAGLALRNQQDKAEAAHLQAECEAAAWASRQALLTDLQRAGNVVHQQYLVLAVVDGDHRLAEVRAKGEHRIAEAAAKWLEAVYCRSEAAQWVQCCKEAAEQQQSAQVDRCTEPAADTEACGQQRLLTPDPD